MPYRPEPELPHGTPSRTAILLINLGTPDEPTPVALRRYLREFLSDPRVVEIPRLAWLPILHGIILNTRPAKSAAKYATVWTDEGSPLAVWTARQRTLLQGYLGERGLRPPEVLVRHAMRYGNPSVASVLDELQVAHAGRILVLPLYPQYAAATTASANDAVMAWAQQRRRQPEFASCSATTTTPATSGRWRSARASTGRPRAAATSSCSASMASRNARSR
jgi:ferrochelatase